MHGISNLLKKIESPKVSFHLPCYVEPLANAFVSHPPCSKRPNRQKSKRLGSGYQRFLDLEAKEEVSSSNSASSNESTDSYSYFRFEIFHQSNDTAPSAVLNLVIDFLQFTELFLSEHSFKYFP